jgi:hypothetical protein
MSLQWDAVLGATGYNLQKKVGEGEHENAD